MTELKLSLQQLAFTGLDLGERSLHVGFLFLETGQGAINTSLGLVVQCHGPIAATVRYALPGKKRTLAFEILGEFGQSGATAVKLSLSSSRAAFCMVTLALA